MKNKYPAFVFEILNRLSTNGNKVYLCGGSVRDFLLGRYTTDFDFATDCSPEYIISLFSDHSLETYAKRFGTIAIKFDSCRFEITTFRHEDLYTEHRHPQIINFIDSALVDSQRRDFTINALYYNGVALIDFHNGLDDLKSKIIRTVNDPNKAFNQDALRMLRAIRFAGELNFDIESSTASALTSNLYLLSSLPLRYFEKEIIKLALLKNFNQVYNNIICKCVSTQFIDLNKKYEFGERIALMATAFNLNLADLEFCYNIKIILKGAINENY